MSDDADPKPSSNVQESFKTLDEQGPIERCFETSLWNSRYIVLLAVIFGIIAAIAMFVVGSSDIIRAIYIAITTADSSHLVGPLIGAIDYYLIGVVLLIFAFGIYELFISHLDIGRLDEEVKVLEIANLDDLKNRIIKVVIMVLIVTFAKKVLDMEFENSQDMLFFALSIFAISFGVYFMHKSG